MRRLASSGFGVQRSAMAGGRADSKRRVARSWWLVVTMSLGLAIGVAPVGAQEPVPSLPAASEAVTSVAEPPSEPEPAPTPPGEGDLAAGQCDADSSKQVPPSDGAVAAGPAGEPGMSPLPAGPDGAHLTPLASIAAPIDPPETERHARWTAIVDDLLARMTVAEKVGQLTLFTSTWDQTGATIDPEYERYLRDGTCGAVFNAFTASHTRRLQQIAVEQSRLQIPLLFGYDVIHGHRTIFPIPLAESCSWDLELIGRAARIAAIEAAAEGIHWTFAPMVDIARDPRWGRVSEGAGEDVWLGCRIAAARVRGFQGADLAATDTVAACAKHFAAYGAAQAGRDYHTVDVSLRTLEEVYLPPFKACVDAGVRTFMTAFNEIAGVPCTSNRWLLTEILRERWRFGGMVVTDYTAINELIPHGVAADERTAGRLAFNAGIDMDMQGGVFRQHLPGLLASHVIDPTELDAAVRRVLWLKAELGLFDDPYRYCDPAREAAVVRCPAHLEAARLAAQRAMVLLQNRDRVLPLSQELKRIAVIGPLATATTDLLGNWHAAGDGALVVSVLAAVRQRFPAGVEVGCEAGLPDVTSTSTARFAAAVALARRADAVILVLGERETMSGEAASRADLDLPGAQNELAAAVAAAAAGKPVVAVLLNGRPLVLERLLPVVPAVLEAWFPGSAGGLAIADVLFGDVAPTGKLTMTFPRAVGQIPIHYDLKNTGRPLVPDNKYTSRYLDIDNRPRFPFGWGLTYGEVTLDALRLASDRIATDGATVATVVVTNPGEREVEETVQLYLRARTGSVTRPVQQLRGFAKVRVPPGGRETVALPVAAADLAVPRLDGTAVVEPGEIEVMVGTSSADVLRAPLIIGQP